MFKGPEADQYAVVYQGFHELPVCDKHKALIRLGQLVFY